MYGLRGVYISSVGGEGYGLCMLDRLNMGLLWEVLTGCFWLRLVVVGTAAIVPILKLLLTKLAQKYIPSGRGIHFLLLFQN